ncbi:hypothetical protein L228DRAFT_150840 [Xylona heveae TC161]|uniref:Uncharacterized protein n=1 Tax=Xylona heveae (strain CBS 132557 / TC161) TaxID=1328760 RepID=A0A165GLG6_XYLHT|nr:hypothetical protein L228DRAFT_150840 [Xylona heveae TC161]KZF22335.1 hypothetical protein L228DRAFT_150840 [Xylona heveae TC161]
MPSLPSWLDSLALSPCEAALKTVIVASTQKIKHGANCIRSEEHYTELGNCPLVISTRFHQAMMNVDPVRTHPRVRHSGFGLGLGSKEEMRAELASDRKKVTVSKTMASTSYQRWLGRGTSAPPESYHSFAPLSVRFCTRAPGTLTLTLPFGITPLLVAPLGEVRVCFPLVTCRVHHWPTQLADINHASIACEEGPPGGETGDAVRP